MDECGREKKSKDLFGNFVAFETQFIFETFINKKIEICEIKF